MPSWLAEDLGFIALLLGIGALLLFWAWWQYRQRRFLFAAAVVAALSLVSGLFWAFVDTDQRRIERKIAEMAGGIPNDLDRVFRHISSTFRYNSHTKDGLMRAARDAIRQRNVTEVRVWDIEVTQIDRTQRRSDVHFYFKIRGNWSAGNEFFLCKAVFHLDDDGEWRMANFQVFNPANIKDPMSVPGL